MSGPPFTMSKYANKTELLADKCEWLERRLAAMNEAANQVQIRYSEILVATRAVGAQLYWDPAHTEARIPRGTPYHDGREPTLIDALFNAVYGAEPVFVALAAAPAEGTTR